MSSAPGAEDRAALIALSGLPGVGPRRLRALLGERPADAVWRAVRGGSVVVDEALAGACRPDQVGELLGRWRAAAEGIDSIALLQAHSVDGQRVLVPGDDAWPARLDDDIDPPALLFVRGDPGVLGDGASVAVVGTRQATRYGLEVARRLGADLSSAGVTVVSGLAAGIDGAAHLGALDRGGAPPAGIVGCGLDVVYPRGHRQLWHRVATAGVLCSETPLGCRPTRWRFPARNRIIAALSHAVVVVESPLAGGSMHTVEEAARRDRPVLAVPGPVTSRASTGANRLLADGAAPACDAADVLVAIGLGGRRPAEPEATPPEPHGDAGLLLDALGWQPATLDQLVLRSGLELTVVARLTAQLEVEGWLGVDGGWFERRR